jgi:general secretion pathway protein E
MEDIRKVYDADARRRGLKDTGSDTATMQKAVIELIAAAASSRCSDIHVEVKRFEAQIFLRSDGVMAKLRDMPSATAQDFCQAAFNMADASDASYKPYEFQGARITSLKTPLPEGVQAVRLQFNPLPDGGRYLVARLLYAQKVGKQADIDELGYTRNQIFQIKRMRRKPIGINIISGPTGSGKSTTLQRSLDAALRDVNYEKNVITVEDPPEYEIVGARQLPVTNVKTEDERKEAFRAAIAASLRSDPDIVMIGEIRDFASASLAFQAAMTGHQVWASLHANSALAILDRLRDMGVELYRLSDETLVTGLIGQRLVRVLCPHCRLPFQKGIDDGILPADRARIVCDAIGEDMARSRVFVGNPKGGCAHKCRSGYTGRTVVADVIQTDRNFMEMYGKGEKTKAHAYWLEHLEGVTMPENALLKCVSGLVDPREVEDKVGLIDEISPERFRTLVAAHDAAADK